METLDYAESSEIVVTQALGSGYLFAVVGLFLPLITVAYSAFTSLSFFEALFYGLLVGILSWLPMGIAMAIIMGLSGGIIGGLVGWVSSLVVKLTKGVSGLQLIIFVFSTVLYGFGSYWIISGRLLNWMFSTWANLFVGFPNIKIVYACVFAIIGGIVAIASLNKADSMSNNDQGDFDLSAPFRVFGRLGKTSVGVTTDVTRHVVESLEEDENTKLQRERKELEKKQRELEKINREFEDIKKSIK